MGWSEGTQKTYNPFSLTQNNYRDIDLLRGDYRLQAVSIHHRKRPYLIAQAMVLMLLLGLLRGDREEKRKMKSMHQKAKCAEHRFDFDIEWSRIEKAHTFNDFIETSILITVVGATQALKIFHKIHRCLKCSYDFLFSAAGKFESCQRAYRLHIIAMDLRSCDFMPSLKKNQTNKNVMKYLPSPQHLHHVPFAFH